MTQDQIKAIAEEFVEQLTLEDVNTEDCVTKSDIIRILKFLSTRFCIVEREKVMETYKHSHTECFMPTTCLDREFARGKCRVMQDLFGTSMFNQNEE